MIHGVEVERPGLVLTGVYRDVPAQEGHRPNFGTHGNAVGSAAIIRIPRCAAGEPERLIPLLTHADLDVVGLGTLKQLGHLAESVYSSTEGEAANLLRGVGGLQLEDALVFEI